MNTQPNPAPTPTPRTKITKLSVENIIAHNRRPFAVHQLWAMLDKLQRELTSAQAALAAKDAEIAHIRSKADECWGAANYRLKYLACLFRALGRPDDETIESNVSAAAEQIRELITRAEKAEAERDAMRTLWTEARVVVAQCRDANCLASYGKAQCDAVAAANAWLNKMPATVKRTIDDASNTEWQLQRVIAERDQLRAEVERLRKESDVHVKIINDADRELEQAGIETENIIRQVPPAEGIRQLRAAIDAARQAQSHSPTTPKPASS